MEQVSFSQEQKGVDYHKQIPCILQGALRGVWLVLSLAHEKGDLLS